MTPADFILIGFVCGVGITVLFTLWLLEQD